MTQAHTAEMLEAKGRSRENGSANTHRTRKRRFIRETCQHKNKRSGCRGRNMTLFETYNRSFNTPTSCSDTQMMPVDTIFRLWSSISLQLISWARWSPVRAWMSNMHTRSTMIPHLSCGLVGAFSGREEEEEGRDEGSAVLRCGSEGWRGMDFNRDVLTISHRLFHFLVSFH